MKWIVLFIVLFVVICSSMGCASNSERATQAMESTLSRHEQVEYGQMSSFPGNVVCGEYRVMGKWDSSGQFKRFIYRDNVMDRRPGSDDVLIFCSSESATSLYDRFGIRVSEQSAKTFAVIRHDFATLSAALEKYYTNNYVYPNSQEGLAVLVGPNAGARKPGPLESGGYLVELPTDPWGRTYLYPERGLAGVKTTVKIFTLGADGREGGKNENADIWNWHMKYIDHIEQL